jgi:hypothetical protein
MTASRNLKVSPDRPILDRLLDRYVVRPGPLSTDCWISTRMTTRGRPFYAYIRFKGILEAVHRVAFKVLVGPIPEDKPRVLHKCDTPPCFRPNHLYAGTEAQNVRDRDARGRTPSGDAHARSKVTSQDVLRLRELCAATPMGQRYPIPASQLGRQLGLSDGQVSRIIRGRAWKLSP